MAGCRKFKDRAVWAKKCPATLEARGAWVRCFSVLEGLVDECFEFDDVCGEATDALGGFFSGHGVFVKHEAEGFLVEGDFFDGVLRGDFWGECGLEGFFGGGELGEELGGDGEEVTAGEGDDFAFVAEGCAHDFGVVAEFFIVVVDGFYGDDAGVFVAFKVCAFGVCFMPVEDAADEGGDELDFRFGAGDGLGEGEEEGEVTMDAFFFEDFSGFDAFPCGGDFDEDAVFGDAFFGVGCDEFFGFGDGAVGVKGEACIDFCGDAAGDDFEDF